MLAELRPGPVHVVSRAAFGIRRRRRELADLLASTSWGDKRRRYFLSRTEEHVDALKASLGIWWGAGVLVAPSARLKSADSYIKWAYSITNDKRLCAVRLLGGALHGPPQLQHCTCAPHMQSKVMSKRAKR